MDVEVTILFSGRYAETAGVREDTVVLDQDIGRAHEVLVEYLERKYHFRPPFNIMVDGHHIIGAKKRGMDLRGGERIAVFPFLSGG